MKQSAIIISVLMLGLVSCKDMQEPVFEKIENIKVSKLGFESSEMTMDVHYYNPNKSKAVLKTAEGEAWVDSSYLGHFHVDSTVKIPGRANFVVPVKLNLDMKYFMKYALSGFQDEDVMVSIKGTARVGKGGFYKKIPLRYDGKQNLKQLFE